MTPAMQRYDLFVYYKVSAVDAGRHHVALKGLQQHVAAAYGIQSGLRFRRGEDGLDTWMEIWIDTPPAFENVLAPMLAESGVLAAIAGPRSCEAFQMPPEIGQVATVALA
jgi:hypothetical protein